MTASRNGYFKSLTVAAVILASPKSFATDSNTPLKYESSEMYSGSPYYDSVLSNESIGSLVATPYHQIYHALDAYTPTNTNTSSIGAQAKRLVKMIAVELPVLHYAKFYQHEFGHGFRARDFGKSVDYEFGLPYPYRLLTKNHDQHPARTIVRGQLSTVESAVVTIGGLESELVLSQHLLDNAALNNEIDRPMLNLYFFLKTSTAMYGTSKLAQSDSDIHNAHWAKQVKSKSMLSLIDPTLISAVISNLTYISTGTHRPSLPWLSIGENFKLLPSLSYYLIPYGESFETQFVSVFGQSTLRANLARWHFAYPYSKNTPGTKGGFIRARYSHQVQSHNVTPFFDIAWSRQPFFSSGSWSKLANSWFLKTGMEFKLSEGGSLIASIGKKNKGYLPHTTIKEGMIYGLGMRCSAF